MPSDAIEPPFNSRQEFVEGMVRYVKGHERWDEFSPEEAVRAALGVMVGDIGAAQEFVTAIGLDVDLYA